MSPLIRWSRTQVKDYRKNRELAGSILRGLLFTLIVMLVGYLSAISSYFTEVSALLMKLFVEMKLVLFILLGGTVMAIMATGFLFWFSEPLHAGIAKEEFDQWVDTVFPILPMRFTIAATVGYLVVAITPTLYFYFFVSSNFIMLTFIAALICLLLVFAPFYYFIFKWLTTSFLEKYCAISRDTLT